MLSFLGKTRPVISLPRQPLWGAADPALSVRLASAAALVPAVIFGSVAMGGNIFCPGLITAWLPEELIPHCIGGGLAEMFGSYFLY